MDYYVIYKKEYPNQPELFKEKLVQTLKTELTNILQICNTNEFNYKYTQMCYIFEYIKHKIPIFISNYVNPIKRKVLLDFNLDSFDDNIYLFHLLQDLNVPDLIYWFYFHISYYNDKKTLQEIKISRELKINVWNYIRDNWDPKLNFESRSFLFITKTCHMIYPLCYHNLPNKIIQSEYSKTIRKICPDLNYINPKIEDIKKSITNIPKLKVCFISDFLVINSSVLKDRMNIIINLPRDKFDVYYASTNYPNSKYIFSTTLNQHPNLKNKFIKLPFELQEARNILQKHQFHIIIYPDIGMLPFQTFLAYSRLAPIQINTWGHSDTSGIDTIDYYFTSQLYEVNDLEEVKSHYSETPILFKSLSTYYTKPSEIALICNNNKPYTLKTRIELGLSNKQNIYWCLQSIYKFTDEFEKCLGAILSQDPNGILLLLDDGKFSRSHQLRLYNNIGEEEFKRVKFSGKTGMIEFINFHKISDVCLDIFPFGGCNTTLEALEQTTPVVTLPSKFINGRFTYGFYKKMGIMDCICYSVKDYIQLALKLGTDRDFNKMIRTKISKKKDLLFNEQDSIQEWSDNLIMLSTKINI